MCTSMNSRYGLMTPFLFQGLTATMAKQGSNQAIRFFVMETLKVFNLVSEDNEWL